ncbi:MAG: hypothetical protein WC635_13840 [Bacteriovorax sp.]|jgi:hypothetical protein
MKKQIKNTSLIFLFIASVLAFKVGDQVELEAYLNARSSAKFLSTSNNVKTQLSKGTKGEILETKKMPSGNYGIKMKVENGPRRGESYWVYYDLKAPKMKLFDAKKREQKPEAVPEQINQSKTGELTVKQEAIREPEETALIDAANNAGQVLQNKDAAQIKSPTTGADCAPLATTRGLSGVSEDKYTESDLVEPYRETPGANYKHSQVCGSAAGGWNVCKSRPGLQVERFELTNSGPNNIVKSDVSHINRQMSFEFDERARSEMKLVVSDAVDEYTSHITYSIMLFFPRSVLPAVKKIGDELEVTLPNKEIVRYNAKTKEVIGGVFTEGPIAANPDNKKAKPANLKYTGDGVMIRADKSGDLPYGDIELNNGSNAPSVSTATISKKGQRDCKIPSKDIWYTDYNREANVFIKPELSSDKGLDEFIKKKCGFSLY